MIQFGQTWWGKQWLEALTHIDNSNRLPRGRTYARNGSVKEIAIEGNVIRGKVKGSMPRPYKVTVALSLFSMKERDVIVTMFVDDPLLL